MLLYKRGVEAQWPRWPREEEQSKASDSGSLAAESGSDHHTQEMATQVLPKLRDLMGLIKPV